MQPSSSVKDDASAPQSSTHRNLQRLTALVVLMIVSIPYYVFSLSSESIDSFANHTFKKSNEVLPDGNKSTEMILNEHHGGNNGAFPPLVLLTKGCSGSTFLINFAKRLVQRHTGLDPFVIVPETFKVNTKNKRFRIAYNYTLAETNKLLADKQLVHDTYNRVSRNQSQIMIPKVFDNHLREGVASALMELDARFVVTYRRNLLNRRVCRIRDCFKSKSARHYTVFQNGSKSDLCFQRRKKYAPKTLAVIDVVDFEEEVSELVGKWGCDGAVEAADLSNRLDQALLRNGKEKANYPRFASERLEEFEFTPKYSVEFNRSVADWMALLSGWGIEPQKQILLDEMSLQGIDTLEHTSALRNVYNQRESKDMMERWAANSSGCDWRWMTKQREP